MMARFASTLWRAIERGLKHDQTIAAAKTLSDRAHGPARRTKAATLRKLMQETGKDSPVLRRLAR